MSKGMDKKKEAKKPAAKTLKEKRAEKQAKKAARDKLISHCCERMQKQNPPLAGFVLALIGYPPRTRALRAICLYYIGVF